MNELKKDMIYAIDQLKDEFLNVGDDTLDDFKDQEWIEFRARHLFIDFCIKSNFKINNFPPHNYKELDSDYLIEDEEWEYYLYRCIIQNKNLQELYWYYYNSFWPSQFQNQEELIDFIDIMTGISEMSNSSYFK
jgi:hypothetical protein